jgi:tetratricopeptide (TPR) repeat protein
MSDTNASSPEHSGLLARVQALYDDGLFTQAYRAAEPLGPLQSWRGTEARILAGRLASQLAADRLSDALFLRAWRADRASPKAILNGVMALQSIRGPLAALDALNASGILDTDSPARWDATAFAAYLYAWYRDFDTAERLITRALDHSGEPWIWSQRAAVYEMEDRYEDALAAARRALDINPRSRSAIQYSARFLSLFERDGEAIELLRDALKSIESTHIAAHLAALEIENGFFAEALTTLARYEELALLKDKGAVSWLAGRRSDVYSHLGDNRRALEQARLSTSGFYKEVARRLETAAPDARRVMLPVGFVRQHHMTCAPATMAALSRFWARPADHLELAEEICYDGTPQHSQRRWAEQHGWHVREFTATWDAARALIDAGVPFTLSTVHPGSAHLQAVIGYDAARGVLFIRDPYDRTHTEFAEEPFFKGYASSGPRGMAMVPEAERARLDAVALPDAELLDLAHELQSALLAHQRERAAALLAELKTRAPGHRITLGAARSLAGYDGDRPAILAIVEQQLAQYPEDVNLRLTKADLLQQLAAHDAYLAYVEQEARGPASHQLLRLKLAQALLNDGRTSAEAVATLRKLARRWNKAETLSSLADAHWQAGEYPRAVFLYRLASALEEANEGHARAYFRAARMVREDERALDYLRGRAARLGKLSIWPHVTLFNCLNDLERATEARAARDEALALHPDDGDLLLFAARTATSVGDRERSEEFLAQAKQHAKPMDWLRAAARLREGTGELEEALSLWLEVVASEPLDLAAQRSVAQLLAETRGRDAAIAHLRALVERFPHHQELNELLVGWLDEEPLPVQEEALRQLIAISPANAWAQRQLAWILGKQQGFIDARAQIELARALAPNAVALHSTEGHIEFMAGRLPEARAAFREALRRDVDSDFAIGRLMEACGSLEERRAELAFVLEEMKRQVVRGDSLLNFQRLAHDTLEPEALAQELDSARAIRPDLWQAWAASAKQRMDMQQYDAARELLQEALGKFPLLPRLHVELAEAARLAGDRAAELAALREALRLSPGWAYATRKLADALEAEGEFAASRALLEAGLRHSPADSLLHGYLGHTLWQLNEREAALEHLIQAVRLDPGYTWGWQTLKERADALGKPETATELARNITEQRPGELRSWMALARIADDDSERLAALDRAIALAPLDTDPHLLKLDLLIDLKRYDEALAALRSTAWGECPPVALRIKEPRVLATRGDTAAAIQRLQEIMADDPNYYPGWELLADWQDGREDYPGYVAAAREMARIAPDHAYALGYLADALRKADPEADTRPQLRRALHLRPDYSFAGYGLFDQELAAGELDAADKALALLMPHVNTGWTHLRRLRLALRRGEKSHALDLFRELWQFEDDDADVFRRAMDAMDEARLGSAADDILHRATRTEGTNPRAGTLWVERRANAKFAVLRFFGFARLLKSGAIGQRAAQALLRHYAKREAIWPLRLMLWRFAPQLAADDMTHGLVSYALVTAGTPRETVKHFGDWRQRPGAEPWALLNLSCALRDLGQDKEAQVVNRHALTLRNDHSYDEHHVWAALDAARAGDYPDAARLLGQVNERALGSYYQFVVCAVRAILAACDGSQPAPEGFKRARLEVGRAQKLMQNYTFAPALRRSLWGAMWHIARARNGNPALAPFLWLQLALA